MTSKAYIVLEDRRVLMVRGDEATTFLQGMISNDINKVSSSCTIYATLLTAQGKFLHDFFVTAAPGGDGVLIDCEGARSSDLLRRLTMYKLRAKAELVDVSTEFDVVAFCGDTALSDLGLAATAGNARPFHDGVVFTDPRLAAMGARAILPANSGIASLREEGFSPVPMAVYHRLRLEHGLPDGSRDIIVEKYFPLECGFDELNAIDYNKGCYIGQELTARTHHRGKIRKRLMPVIVDGPLPPPGTAVLLAEREVGEIRSGDADRAIALIRLEHFDTAQSGAVAFTAGEAKVFPVKPDWAKF